MRVRYHACSAIISLLCFICSGCATLSQQIPLLDPDHKNFKLEHEYSVSDPQFERSIGHILGPGILPGNKVETLLNGDQIFPSMLDAIRSAKQTIDFETFVYWSGDIGRQFAEALASKAKEGVKVYVVIDWFGMSKIDRSFLKIMKDAGVKISIYHEPAWYDIRRLREMSEVNNRTHRKILVVDGKIGFTGGVGIADEWKGNADSPEHWRDTHYRITGPVVAQLQAAFIENWMESGGELLHGDRYFPELPEVGNVRAQVFEGSPHDASDSIELMYRMAIVSAEKSVMIENSYFVPDEGIVRTLIDAAKRGVRVEIIVPGEHMDQQVVAAASKGIWGELLRAGVKIFEYQPTMIHCKVMVVDDFFTSVGSTNFDNRSFNLNDEVNLNVFDAGIAAEQIRILEQDKTSSRELTYEQWKSRPFYERIADWFVLLFRAEL